MGNNQSAPQTLPQEVIDEVNTFASKEPKEIKTYLKNKCNEWQNTKVNIGITGLSHRGKSTFINTVRDIKPGEPGAAAVKNQECTVKAGFYEFPSNENITLVDLPGVGTNNFPKDDYFERIGFTEFDFFLIFAKDSYTETDTWMATNLKKRGKKFFFVRTFMDRAIEEAMFDNNMQIRETDEAGKLTEEMKEFMNQEMEKVKAYCREELKKRNHDDVPIYCISNRHKDRFEFSKLIVDIGENLPEIQKDALTLSTNIFTEEVFKAKKKILKKKIMCVAGISGAAGAIPVPGIDLIIDIPLILSTIKFFKQQFNIDYEKDPHGGFFKKSLKKIRNKFRSNTENAEDQEILTDKLHFQISENETEGLSDESKRNIFDANSLLHRIVQLDTRKYVTALLLRYAVAGALEETTKIAAVATLGIFAGVASLIGGALSFGVTYHLLSSELDKIEKLANEAVKLKIEDMIK